MSSELKMIFTDYGLGKYYIYTKGGENFYFIEMNIHMYHYNKELFYWVLQHELKHSKFYADVKNRGKRDLKTEVEQDIPTKINRRMKREIFKFQLKHWETVVGWFMGDRKRFAVKEDPYLLNPNGVVNYHKVDALPPEEELRIRFYLEGL